MKISEILTENYDQYPTNIPLSDYRGPSEDEHTENEKSVIPLWHIIDQKLNANEEPEVVDIPTKNLLATQSWLSNWGSDGATWDELKEYPVVLHYRNEYLILDGHHRVSAALKSHKPKITVYYYTA